MNNHEEPEFPAPSRACGDLSNLLRNDELERLAPLLVDFPHPGWFGETIYGGKRDIRQERMTAYNRRADRLLRISLGYRVHRPLRTPVDSPPGPLRY